MTGTPKRAATETATGAAPATSGAGTHDAGTRTLIVRVFRGDPSGGTEVDYEVPIEPGMVVLDAIHWIQAHRAPTSPCAGTARRRNAARAAPR